ncbi:MAG TPA: ABC transporter permease [Acidimicrobiales bacterium]|nr:ABC transporter permease [Acidimicrobiales bacterium]
MNGTLAVARSSLLRVTKDRRALFFLIVLPVVVILIIGATVRGFSTIRVGVVDLGAGQAGRSLTAAMQRAGDLDLRHYPTVAAATTAVARGEVATAVLLPRGMGTAVRSGAAVDVPVLADRSNSTQQAAAAAVESVVANEGARIQAAHFAASRGLGTFEEDLSRAAELQRTTGHSGVVTRVVDSSSQTLPQGFSYSAPTMLVLFVFLNALASGAVIIETRRLGLYERMAVAPIRRSTIVAGETLAYFTVALIQAALIVLIGAVVFGVSWGDPTAAGALVLVWALVGAGAGVLSGTLFRTPEQASAIGPPVGIALAMLGGCMWPLSIVSSFMRQLGHITPQAWAVDAWTDLLSRGGNLSSIAPKLAVLAAFAAGLLVLASTRLRRVVAYR